MIVRGLAALETTTGTKVAVPCKFAGVLCTISSSLVISVYDGTSTAGKKIVSNYAMAAGGISPPFASGAGAAMQMQTGVHVVVESGTGTFDVLICG